MRNSLRSRSPAGQVRTDAFTLKGGINLVDAPIAIPDGMCLSAINYELLTTDGYRRSDGYERYDGQALASDASYWIVNFDAGGQLTGWGVSTAAYTGNNYIMSIIGLAWGFTISADETKMYVIDTIAQTIRQFAFSVPGDASTVTSVAKSFNYTGQMTGPRAVRVSSDGTIMYLADINTGVIYQYTMSGGDLDTVAYASKSLDVSTAISNLSGFDISPDGTKLIAGGNDDLQLYDLSVAGDIGTATATGTSFSIGNGLVMSDLKVSSDGLNIFILFGSEDIIHQYPIGTAHDPNTIDLPSLTTFVTTTEESSPIGLHVTAELDGFYVVGFTNKTLFQYSMTSPPEPQSTPEVGGHVTGITSGAIGRVGAVVVDSGAFASGNAVGYVAIYTLSGGFIDDEQLAFIGSGDEFTFEFTSEFT